MLINGGLGELREGTDRYYRYDDDREYGVEKRFTCVVDGEEVAFSGWGKTVILPKSEALAITGLLAGRAKRRMTSSVLIRGQAADYRSVRL